MTRHGDYKGSRCVGISIHHPHYQLTKLFIFPANILFIEMAVTSFSSGKAPGIMPKR
jgi:hypothetical protein